MATSDVVLKGVYKFTQALAEENRGGIVILNGDGFLITKPEIKDGWSLIVYPEELENVYGSLGIVVTSEGGVVESFVEKPKKDEFWSLVREIQKKNPQHPFVQLADSGKALANSASGIISFQSLRKQTEVVDALLNLHEKIARDPHEVDTSGDFLIPLTVDRWPYLGRKAQKMGPGTAESYFGPIYDVINHLFKGRLYGVGEKASFYRDPAETRMLVMEYGNETGDLFQYFGFLKRPNSLVHPEAKIDSAATIASSRIPRGVQIASGVVVVKSYLYQLSRVGEGSFVYRVRGRVDLDNQEWLTQIPTRDGKAIVYLGIVDDTRAPLETAKIFGRPFKEWLTEKELTVFLESLPEKQKGDIAKEALWNLPIWPVQKGGRDIDFSLVSWMARVGAKPHQGWLHAKKISLAELSQSDGVNYKSIRQEVWTAQRPEVQRPEVRRNEKDRILELQADYKRASRRFRKGPSWGLDKQKEVLKQAFQDHRFYPNLISVSVKESDAKQAVKLLESFQGTVLPPYVFIFRTDEDMREVKRRLARFQEDLRKKPGYRSTPVVPVAVVVEPPTTQGTLSGVIFARTTLKNMLRQMGFSWDELKVKYHLLAAGKGMRSFPEGETNRILSRSPLGSKTFLEQNLMQMLQYFSVEMKLPEAPGSNFVIYADKYASAAQNPEFGKQPIQVVVASADRQEKGLAELGIVALSPEGAITRFLEKPREGEIEIRLGDEVKLQKSLGDLYYTEPIGEALEGHYGAVPKADFARDLFEPLAGLETWLERSSDPRPRRAMVTQGVREMLGAFKVQGNLIGAVSIGKGGVYHHSNSVRAHHEMSLMLAGSHVLEEMAGVGQEAVVLGNVTVEPGAVVMGPVIMDSGKLGGQSAVHLSWLSRGSDVKPGSRVIGVDGREGPIVTETGFAAYTVHYREGSETKKITFMRRMDDSSNQTIKFAAVVVTLKSLINKKGNIDRQALSLILQILQEESGPHLAIVTHEGKTLLERLVLSPLRRLIREQGLPLSVLDRLVLYSENGAVRQGFEGGKKIDYSPEVFTEDDHRLIQRRALEALKKFAPSGFKIDKNLPAMISYEVEDSNEMLNAAHTIQDQLRTDGVSSFHIFVWGKKLVIALEDRKSVIPDLDRRILKREGYKWLIIGGEAATLDSDGHQFTGPDKSLLEIIKNGNGLNGIGGQTFSLSVNPNVLGLSQAVVTPVRENGVAATIHALEEVLRSTKGRVSFDDWRWIGNEHSLRRLHARYDQDGADQFAATIRRAVRRATPPEPRSKRAEVRKEAIEGHRRKEIEGMEKMLQAIASGGEMRAEKRISQEHADRFAGILEQQIGAAFDEILAKHGLQGPSANRNDKGAMVYEWKSDTSKRAQINFLRRVLKTSSLEAKLVISIAPEVAEQANIDVNRLEQMFTRYKDRVKITAAHVDKVLSDTLQAIGLKREDVWVVSGAHKLMQGTLIRELAEKLAGQLPTRVIVVGDKESVFDVPQTHLIAIDAAFNEWMARTRMQQAA